MKHIKGHCRQWIAKQKPIPKKTIIVISAKKISSHPRICLLDLYTDHTRKHASSTVSEKIDLQALAYPSFMEGTEPYLFFLQCLCGLANIIAALYTYITTPMKISVAVVRFSGVIHPFLLYCYFQL